MTLNVHCSSPVGEHKDWKSVQRKQDPSSSKAPWLYFLSDVISSFLTLRKPHVVFKLPFWSRVEPTSCNEFIGIFRGAAGSFRVRLAVRVHENLTITDCCVLLWSCSWLSLSPIWKQTRCFCFGERRKVIFCPTMRGMWKRAAISCLLILDLRWTNWRLTDSFYLSAL